MTTAQGKTRGPDRGWRIERILGRPLHRTEDGRLAVPLWLVRDGRHVADVELVMSAAEAEQLHASLCRVLDADGQAPPAVPACRLPLQPSRIPQADL